MKHLYTVCKNDEQKILVPKTEPLSKTATGIVTGGCSRLGWNVKFDLFENLDPKFQEIIEIKRQHLTILDNTNKKPNIDLDTSVNDTQMDSKTHKTSIIEANEISTNVATGLVRTTSRNNNTTSMKKNKIRECSSNVKNYSKCWKQLSREQQLQVKPQIVIPILVQLYQDHHKRVGLLDLMYFLIMKISSPK